MSRVDLFTKRHSGRERKPGKNEKALTNKAHESSSTIYPLSSLPLWKTNQQQRDEAGARSMMNNPPSLLHYVLSDFKTLEAQTQALQLNSVYSREKVNIFSELKTCTVWIFWRTMTDVSAAAACPGEQGSSHRITSAYPCSPAAEHAAASAGASQETRSGERALCVPSTRTLMQQSSPKLLLFPKQGTALCCS